MSANQITMLSGGTIFFDGDKLVAANSEAGIVTTDIRVDNGMIHVIDTVLLP